MKKSLLVVLSIAAAGVMGVAATANHVKTAKAGEEITIKPFAEYKFQDADNLGEDTSGNGFHLTTMKTSVKDEAIRQLTDEGDGSKYLSIRHDREQTELGLELAPTGGGWLYAPELGSTNKDFSDLIEGSFTVSVTLSAEFSYGFGNAYALNFGRYCSTLQIVPWKNAIEISTANADFYDPTCGTELQDWLQGYRYYLPMADGTDWTWQTITITGDIDVGVYKVYLNGEYKADIQSPNGLRLTNHKEDLEASSYTFSIGGQCDVRGSSVDALIGAVCDYKQVTVYDCLLSAANVKAIYDGENAVISKQDAANQVYVTNIEALNPDDYDLDITDVNTVFNVIKDQLGAKKAKVTTSEGTTRSYKVIYYPSGNGQQILGKVIVDDAINVENTQLSLDYKYVCKIDYDPNKVIVSDVIMDKSDYELGTEITSSRHTVRFVLTPKEGITITAVNYNDMEWDPEDDGDCEEGSFEYFVTFTKGAYITVDTSGEVPGGTSSSEPAPVTSSESAPAQSSASTPTPTSSNAPAGSSEGGKSGGCGGSIAAAGVIVSVVALAGASILFKKKEK